MNKETLVNKVSDALYDEREVIFVGNGISAKSTHVDWFKLLKEVGNLNFVN